MNYTKVIDIKEVKRANEDAKKFFFSRSAMQFFRSRCSQYAYKVGDKAYFTTSEQFNDTSPRLHTVRVCNLITGDIDTVGEFNQLTYKQARHLLIETVKLAKNGVDVLKQQEEERKEFYQQA